MFEKVSEFIYVKSRLIPGIKPDAGVIRTINYLYPAGDIKETYKAFEIKRISLSLLILTAGIILSVFMKISEVTERSIGDGVFEREEWNGEKQTVTMKSESGNIIKLEIGSDVMKVNGEEVHMDTSAIIKDNRTYIPVRFIAEAIGYEVNWIC